MGICSLSVDSELQFAEMAAIALVERRYQNGHYPRYHLISPVGSGRGLGAGSIDGLGLGGSIKELKPGFDSQCEPCDAAARRAPRRRLSPLPGRLGVGDEVSASGLTDGDRWSRPS